MTISKYDDIIDKPRRDQTHPADALKQDYTSIDFDGETFWGRA